MALLTKKEVNNAVSSLTPKIEDALGKTSKILENDLNSAMRLEKELLSKLKVDSIEALNQKLIKINNAANRLSTLYTSGIDQASIEDVFLKELADVAKRIKDEKTVYDNQFLQQAKQYLENAGGGSNLSSWLSADFSKELNKTLSFDKHIFSHKIDINLFSGLSEEALISALLNQMTEEQKKRLIVLVNQHHSNEEKWTYKNFFKTTSGAELYTSQTTTNDSVITTIKINSNTLTEEEILKSLAQFNESDFKEIPNGDIIRRNLVMGVQKLILSRVGTSDPLLQSIIVKVFDPGKSHMIFQGGNSVNHLRGLLGEIHGLYVFHALFGEAELPIGEGMNEIIWNAQSRDAQSKQSHADIVLRFADKLRFGIQIKNYNSINRNIGFAKGSFATLAKYLPELDGLKETINEIYQMHHFNVSYFYKNGVPVAGFNENFGSTRQRIENLKILADKVLAQCASGLMYLQTRESVGVDPNSNTLMLVGGKNFISSAQILQDIYDDAQNSGFSAASSWIDQPDEGTIVDYIKKNSYKQVQIKVTSSYNFGRFRS